MSEDDEYYQDDFEDYEDDFEDDEEIEVAPHCTTQSSLGTHSTEQEIAHTLQDSLHRESETAGYNLREGKYGPPKKTFLPSKESIGPSDAQRAVLQLRYARWRALKPQIHLEVMEWDCLFELSPLTSYELMRRGLGDFSTKRAMKTQTCDDLQTEEAQTDDIEHQDQQCQVPDDLGKSRWELEHSEKKASNTPHMKDPMELSQGFGHRSVRLTDFVRRASDKVLAILSDQRLPVRPPVAFSSSWCFNGITDASLSLQPYPPIKHQSVTHVSLAPGLEPLLLVVYRPSQEPDPTSSLLDGGSTCGQILIWHLNHADQPLASLSSEGIPSCCCWSPGDVQQFVFSGMEEGGVCMWDIREIDTGNNDINPGEAVRDFRPVYTTEYAPDHEFTATVVTVAAVDSQSRRFQSDDTLDQKWRQLRGDMNMELLCLSSWGHVTIWGVKELTGLDAATAQQCDWGLRIGGRVRLVSIASGVPLGRHLLPNVSDVAHEVPQTACLVCDPSHPHQFFVGSDGGRVLRGAKSGRVKAPKTYSPHQPPLRSTQNILNVSNRDSNKHNPSNKLLIESSFQSQFLWCHVPKLATVATLVTCLCSSQCVPSLFIAGHSESLIALYHVSKAHPIRVWEGIAAGGVSCVKFLPTRASIFLALFSPSSTLCCIDILGEGAGIVSKISVTRDGSNAVTMDLLGGVVSEEVDLIVGYEDGSVQVHKVAEILAKGRPNEESLVLEEIGR